MTAFPGGVRPASRPEEVTAYRLHTPRGFTDSLTQDTIEVLERLGLIEHERDGYDLTAGSGDDQRGVGPLVRWYRAAGPLSHR